MIPAVSLWLPAYDVLETMTELTKHDCDHACRDESNKRALAFKTRIHIDNHDDYSKMSYKIIKESQPLSEVPVERCFSAKLLRASVGHTALLISDDFIIPPHANLKMDDADLKFIRQEGRKVFFKHLRGNLPSSGTLKVSFVATTASEIGGEFSHFWSKMWKREDRQEQFCDRTWNEFANLFDETPLPLIPQITYPFGCVKSWIAIIKGLPAGKAVGPCGWSNDELKALPYCCIEDLCWMFQKIASVGFDTGFMMAKTVLLAKVPIPLSMNHARPITILSCLYRLFGRFIFRHTARVWKQYLPFPISGGLPGRGVKELAFSQKREIENAIKSNCQMGGHSLDLIKAYNTFGRFAVAQIMCRLGMPMPLLDAWIASLDRMVRFPHINGHVTAGISSTTGVPEGCSISVLSMLATSTLYYYRLAEQHVRPFAYADNWSWMSSQQRSHFVAYQRMLQLVQVMRLKIDFKRAGTGALQNPSVILVLQCKVICLNSLKMLLYSHVSKT